MGIFFSYDEYGRFVFNEIEAVDPNKKEDNDTSTTDYTQDNDDDQTPEDNGGGDNPQDAPEDYTISDDNGGEDQTPEEADNNPPEEGTEATGGDQPPEGGGDTGGTDYTADGGGDTVGGDTGGGDPGGDPDAGGDGTDEGGGDDMGGDDDTTQSEDDIKALEDEIYSNYSDEQRQIMTKELKTSMNKLVTLSGDLVDRINDIPKVASHIRIIEFVSNKLSDFRDMLTDYLYYTYDTESYVKNKIAYERFIKIMSQIDELISKIPTVGEVKNKNGDSQD